MRHTRSREVSCPAAKGGMTHLERSLERGYAGAAPLDGQPGVYCGTDMARASEFAWWLLAEVYDVAAGRTVLAFVLYRA